MIKKEFVMGKIFDKAVKIKFLTGGTSPSIGNLYFGKISTVEKTLAKKFINSGAAEYYDDAAESKDADNKDKTLADYSVQELKEVATNLKIEFKPRVTKLILIEEIEKKLAAGKVEENTPLFELSLDELKEKAVALEIDFIEEIEAGELVSLIGDVLKSLEEDNNQGE